MNIFLVIFVLVICFLFVFFVREYEKFCKDFEIETLQNHLSEYPLSKFLRYELAPNINKLNHLYFMIVVITCFKKSKIKTYSCHIASPQMFHPNDNQVVSSDLFNDLDFMVCEIRNKGTRRQMRNLLEQYITITSKYNYIPLSLVKCFYFDCLITLDVFRNDFDMFEIVKYLYQKLDIDLHKHEKFEKRETCLEADEAMFKMTCKRYDSINLFREKALSTMIDKWLLNTNVS
jgi:hypothetical protein